MGQSAPTPWPFLFGKITASLLLGVLVCGLPLFPTFFRKETPRLRGEPSFRLWLTAGFGKEVCHEETLALVGSHPALRREAVDRLVLR